MEIPVLYMAKPVGGRGKTASKPTIMRRIPEGIKDAVEQLAEQYREDQWDGNLDNLISGFGEDNKPDISFNELEQELLELRQWKTEREELDQECDRLTAKVGDLDLEKQNLADQLEQTRAELEKVRSHKTDAPNFSLPDLTKLRDRVLAELKLGKQAPGYKAAQKALDSFIKQLGKT